MIGDWTDVTIEEIKAPIAHAIAMGPFGSDIKTDNFVPSGVPVIRGVNLGTGRFNDKDFVFLTEDKADELHSANAYPEDIIFTHRGTLGQVGIIPHSCYPRYVVSQSQMKLSCDKKKADPLFIFYYFRSPLGQHQLLANTSTTGVPAISRPLTSLRSIQIPLPPLSEQYAIASVLSNLDDKIELNCQMNETLEAIVRAIFKSWFVDFDQVRAKIKGHEPYGMKAETAALFPDSFEVSTLGEIPKGWKVGLLGDVTDNPRRGVTPNDINQSTPYIGLEHMPRKSIALGEWGLAQDVTSNKFRFYQGEILFGKLRPYFHKVGVAVQDGVCSTDILVIIPKSPEWYSFVLAHVSSDEFVQYTDAASTGTKMPRTSWQDMKDYKIVLPPKNIVEAFNKTVLSLVEAICSNILQTHALISIRDTLLPKLLSGEIRVKYAEKYAEALL